MQTLIGNNAAKTQFTNYLNHNQANNRPIFLIIIWPEGIGKTSFLRQYTENTLWTYASTDFFRMRDCSKELWKAHSIQVETPDKLKTIPLSETLLYDNKGIREINTRLQQSSLSWKKVLLIENIQRMTNASMNAFLKTCEEPLPNRYLFATAEHESWILPTILSRAMVIKFSPLNQKEMDTYITQTFPELQWEKKEIIEKLAMWKPWTLHAIYEKFQSIPEAFENVTQLLSLLKTKGNRAKKIQYLKFLDENQLLESFQTLLIKEYAENQNSLWAETRIKVKKYISSNVNQENALRYWILSSEN